MNRKVILAAAGLLTVLALFLAGALVRFLWEEGSFPASGNGEPPSGSEDSGALVLYEGTWYAPRSDVETVLVLGLDRSEREGIGMTGSYAQSDLMLLLEIDRTSETCRVIHLNRDTMATIQDFDRYGRPAGTYTAQLTLAYAHAQAYTGNDTTACMSAVKAVSELLYGVKIDGYAAIQMEAIPILNDMVGGVTVTIEDDFSLVDPTLVQGETVTLKGEQAFHFIHDRYDVADGSNLSRMGRHRAYMHGFDEAFTAAAKEDRELVLKMYDAAHSYLVTDMGSKSITNLAEQCLGYENGGVVTMEGEAKLGETFMEFYPDEAGLRQTVLDLFYTEIPAD